MQKEIRRCNDHLVSIGTGVTLFGIWTVIRLVVSIFLERKNIFGDLEAEVTEELTISILTIIFWGLIIIMALLILALHLFIGLSARAEGLGRKKKIGYLIFTGIFIVLYCILIPLEIVHFNTTFESVTNGVVTLFIDTSVLVTLAELMYNAIRVRKLSAQLAGEGSE